MKKERAREEDKSRLLNLEQKIYSKDNPVLFKDRRSIIHDNTTYVDTVWDPIEDQEGVIKESEKSDNAFFSKISHRVFYLAVIFFLVSSSLIIYQFLINGDGINSNKIGLEVETPAYIDGGQEFPVDVLVTNKNKGTLERVDIILEYPKGESMTSVEDTVLKRVPLGNVVSGESKKGTIDAALFGKEGSIRNIKVTIEYYAPGSSTVLKKDITKTLTLKSAPLVITTESLKEVTSNGQVALTIHVSAERGQDINNFLLNVVYPNGFTFERSSIEPRYGNNFWLIDSLPKGSVTDITIYGRLRGEDGDEKTFRIAGGSENIWNPGVVSTVYADTKAIIAIKKPFIDLVATFEDVPKQETGEYAIKPGTRVTGVINYHNNVPDTISNVEVSARLTGEILNRAKVTVNGGYYDSAKNLIIWNQTTLSKLKEILPGESGDLKFAIESYPLSAKQNGYFSNPEIKIEGAVTGKRLSDINVPEIYSEGSPLVARVISEAGVTASLLTSESPLETSGPVPPVHEVPTVYTLVLKLQNRSNDINGAKVKFTLPPYVEYSGKYTPADSIIKYDSNTREVTWDIGALSANTGFGQSDKSVFINLTLTPSLQQVGEQPVVVPEFVFTGTDTFTKTNITTTTFQIRTKERVQ